MILNKNDQLLELTRFERDLKMQKEEIARNQEEEFLQFCDNLRETEGLELHNFIERINKEKDKLIKDREALYKVQLIDRSKINLNLVKAEISKEIQVLESKLKEDIKQRIDVYKLKLDNELTIRNSQGITEFNLRKIKLEKEIQDEKDMQERSMKKIQTTEELIIEEGKRYRRKNDEDLNRKVEEYRNMQETIIRNKTELDREKASEIYLMGKVNEINSDFDRRIRQEREQQEKSLRVGLMQLRENREFKLSEEVEEAYKTYEPDRLAFIKQSQTQSNSAIQKIKYGIDIELNKEFESRKKRLYDVSQRRFKEFTKDLDKLDNDKATLKDDIKEKLIYLEKSRAKLLSKTSHIDIDLDITKASKVKHIEKIEQIKRDIEVWKNMKTTKVKEMTDIYKAKQKELKRLKAKKIDKTDKLEKLINEFRYLITEQKIVRPTRRIKTAPISRPKSIPDLKEAKKENFFSMNEAFSFEEEAKQVDFTSSDLLNSKYKPVPLRQGSYVPQEDRIKAIHEDTLELPDYSHLIAQDFRYIPRRDDPWIIENISLIQEASKSDIQTSSPMNQVYKKYLTKDSSKCDNLKQILRKHREWLSGVVQEVIST